MEILELISHHIYIAYILVAIVLLIIIICILYKLSLFNKTLTPIKKNIEDINNDIDLINNKKAIIDNTMKTSVPFFLRGAFYITVLKMAFRDYRDTKRSRRSFIKSYRKAYNYQTLINENKRLKKK